MKNLDLSAISNGIEMSPTLTKYTLEGHLERFDALLKALTESSSDVVVLYGCEWTISGMDYDMTAGVVWYNGKMYSADAFSGTNPGGQIPVWQAPSFVAEGDQALFADNVFRNVTGQDKMTLVMATSGSGVSDYDDVKNMATVISDLIGFAPYSSPSNITYENSYNFIGSRGKYRKDSFGNVKLMGDVRSPSSVTDSHFATLPVGYRPQFNMYFPVAGAYNAGGVTGISAVVLIFSNGECHIFDTSRSNITGNRMAALDSIYFNINDV